MWTFFLFELVFRALRLYLSIVSCGLRRVRSPHAWPIVHKFCRPPLSYTFTESIPHHHHLFYLARCARAALSCIERLLARRARSVRVRRGGWRQWLLLLVLLSEEPEELRVLRLLLLLLPQH